MNVEPQGEGGLRFAQNPPPKHPLQVNSSVNSKPWGERVGGEGWEEGWNFVGGLGGGGWRGGLEPSPFSRNHKPSQSNNPKQRINREL